ncbi:hypothetical protein Tco_0994023 [Tanacetum coccineum]
MGMDTIQVEDAVSTISEEYLLEFTFEYGILESLHPELPSPEETIMDFPEGKVSVYTKIFEFENYRIPMSQFLFDILGHYQIHLSQLSVIGAAKQAAEEEHSSVLYKAPGLLEELEQPVILGGRENIPYYRGMAHKRPKGWDAISRLLFRGGRDNIEHTPYRLVQLDQCPESYQEIATGLCQDPTPLITERYGEKEQTHDGLSHGIPPVQNLTTTEAVPEPDPEKESTLRGKSLAAIGLDVGFTLVTPATQETPSDAKSVSDPDLLSYAKPQPRPERDVA